MKRFIFIIILFFCSAKIFSQGLDTVWTYNLQPDYLKNAVFSPDDQFVFATHYDYNFPEKLRLSKFDKDSGKLLWKTDSISGIKQFSDDGKFFYTYDLKKYSYPEFELVNQTQIDKDIKFAVWELAINEKFNSLIVVNDRRFKDPPFYNRNYDSSLVFINSTNMKMENFVSHRDTSTWLKNIAISPTKPQFITASSEGRRYIFDLWDLSTKNYIKNISYYEKMEYYDIPIIHYSPDGKLLGILTDSLRLYETENYNWVYTLPIQYIRLFQFSNDSKSILVSIQTRGLYKFDLVEKIKVAPSFLCSSIFFISKQSQNMIVTNHILSLALLKEQSTELIEQNNSNLIFTQLNDMISIKNINLSVYHKISLYDINGNILKYINIKENQNEILIDISFLNIGSYFIKFENEDTIFTHKFIIVR